LPERKGRGEWIIRRKATGGGKATGKSGHIHKAKRKRSLAYFWKGRLKKKFEGGGVIEGKRQGRLGGIGADLIARERWGKQRQVLHSTHGEK